MAAGDSLRRRVHLAAMRFMESRCWVMQINGYLSYEIGGPISHSLPPNPGGKYNHGIVTPHASFLALCYARARRSPIYGLSRHGSPSTAGSDSMIPWMCPRGWSRGAFWPSTKA